MGCFGFLIGRRYWLWLNLVAATTISVAYGASGPAAAFDFFGLFGADDPPDPSPITLPYRVTFEVVGDADVKNALQDSSTMWSLRQDAPPDGAALVQRLKTDFAPMLDSLWGEGYYNARLSATVAGVEVNLERSEGDDGVAIRTAAQYRNRQAVPVTITADPGPQFKIRSVTVLDSETGRAFDAETLPPRILKLNPGDPARAVDVRAANARLIDYFRSQSYPLVKAPLPHPTVDHASLTMDVTFTVDTNAKAGFGNVTVKGPEGFDSSIIRSYIYLEPGQPYSPKALADTRKSIASIPAVGSVRIREADHFDPDGNLPLFVDVTDRKSNLIGFAAGYSTVDGPTTSVYYENRNLFGGAESLRLQGDVFVAPRINGTNLDPFRNFRFSDLGERFKANFVKPALNGSRFDLLIDAMAEHNRIGGGWFGGYEDRLAGGTVALRYRLNEVTSLQAGVKYENGLTRDTLGQIDYGLVGIPLLARYDTTDKPLDPTEGIRLNAAVTPYLAASGNASDFTRASLTGSAYYALDDDSKYVLASRIGFGSVFGESGGLTSIPSNYRFYVGGLDSVRGYRFHTISPTGGPYNFIIGGMSSFSAQTEARIKITENIGIAPFFDIGGVCSGSVPFANGGDTQLSTGLGLLYYTPIGPLRVDLATPLNPRQHDRRLVLYVSIGQPF